MGSKADPDPRTLFTSLREEGGGGIEKFNEFEARDVYMTGSIADPVPGTLFTALREEGGGGEEFDEIAAGGAWVTGLSKVAE